MKQSLIFFSDSKVLGGHELMCLEAVRSLLSSGRWEISFFYWRGNERLNKALNILASEMSGLFLRPSSVSVRKANAIVAPFCIFDILRLRREFCDLGSPAVILCQGRIENGTVGAIAAKLAGCMSVSYLPMAHTLAEMGHVDFMNFREKILLWHYRLPQAYITISESIGRQIAKYVPQARIGIVSNPLLLANEKPLSQADARFALGLSPVGTYLAVIGRIEFSQKGQDFLLLPDVLRFLRERRAQVVFVGDGSDESTLRTSVADRGAVDLFRFVPFAPGLAKLYRAFDIVLMPSRYEGVPLTMLEALSFGVPVIATDRDGMRDVLPDVWRFDGGNVTAMLMCIERVLKDPEESASRAAELASGIPDAAHFGAAFEAAVLKITSA
jgi:glycosyltransferase involved in cell wall biosynthesis